MDRSRWMLSACIACLALGPVQAATPGASPTGRMLACHEMRDPDRRLACYDALAAQLGSEPATREGEAAAPGPVERDRAAGFGLPKNGVPAGARREPRTKTDVLKVYDGTIVSVGAAAGYETYVLRLADGAAWRTIEAGEPPSSGEPIHITRGLIGNYLANIKGRRAIRVERVR